MKLNEIMVIRKVDGEDRLKVFQVDDNTLTKLTRIRGSFYKDDPRLQVAKDLPTPEPEIPEHIKRQAEKSYLTYKTNQQASPVQTVKAEVKPMTLEEEVQHTWRFNPGIRKEFTSFGSYQAFMRAAKTGRTKVYGKA